MNLNHRPPGPALGAQWTFAFCKLLILKDWSGRMDLNHRPPGPEPGALARLRYAPTDNLGRNLQSQGAYQINTALRLRATACQSTVHSPFVEQSTSEPRWPDFFMSFGSVWSLQTIYGSNSGKPMPPGGDWRVNVV